MGIAAAAIGGAGGPAFSKLTTMRTSAQLVLFSIWFAGLLSEEKYCHADQNCSNDPSSGRVYIFKARPMAGFEGIFKASNAGDQSNQSG